MSYSDNTDRIKMEVTIGRYLPSGEFTVYTGMPFILVYGDPNDFLDKPVRCGNKIVGKIVELKEDALRYVRAVVECHDS